MMSRLRLNLLSNYVGSIWAVLLQLALIPLYIRFMGIEQYGLVGFYLTLQATLQILDFGLSPTISREMARYSAQPARAGEARDLILTLGVGYFALGLVIGLGIAFTAPLIATHWLKVDALPSSTVQNAIILMGVLFILQWPLSFFTGGLMGLQLQVLANGLKIAMQTLGGVGAILSLWLVSSNIMVFLVWQMVNSALGVSLTMILLWKNLPISGRDTRFNFSLLRNVWRFVTGAASVGLVVAIVTQMDKVISSALVDLKMFGYYTLAGSVVTGLAAISTPVFNAIFPRFSSLIAEERIETLTQLYYRSFQFLAVILWPAMAFLSLFSYEILLIWTGNVEIALNVAPIVTVLAIGTTLNSMTVPPYALHLAYGRMRSLFSILGMDTIIILPVMIFMTIHYGVVGTAISWMIFNVFYFSILLHITHRHLLPNARWNWYLENLGKPLVGSLVILGLVRFLLPTNVPPLILLIILVVTGVCSLVAAFSMSPLARSLNVRMIWGEILRQKKFQKATNQPTNE